jgi:radical SAM protein with 4Fe4S-binding SPASM domain
VTDHNRHEIDRFAAEWSAVASVMIKEARDWAGQVVVPLGKKDAARPAAAVPAPPAASLASDAGACRMLWTELTVLWDGLVVPCANVFERQNLLGDLSRQSLDEVWNGPALQALRAAHLRDEVSGIPVCATCPRQRFDHEGFIAVDQLTQRVRHYRSSDLLPRPGLS